MGKMIAVYVADGLERVIGTVLKKHGFKYGTFAQGFSIYVGPASSGKAFRAEFRKLLWTRPCGKGEAEFLLS